MCASHVCVCTCEVESNFSHGEFFFPVSPFPAALTCPVMWESVSGLSVLFHLSLCVCPSPNATLSWLPQLHLQGQVRPACSSDSSWLFLEKYVLLIHCNLLTYTDTYITSQQSPEHPLPQCALITFVLSYFIFEEFWGSSTKINFIDRDAQFQKLYSSSHTGWPGPNMNIHSFNKYLWSCINIPPPY